MTSPVHQEIKVKGKAQRIRGATWTNDQVKKLFEVWTQPDIYQGLLNEKKKLDIFKNMAAILTSRGVPRTWSECRAKIKNLKADFRKAMEKKSPFRYFEQMKKIMNLDGSSTTTSATDIRSQQEERRYLEQSESEDKRDDESSRSSKSRSPFFSRSRSGSGSNSNLSHSLGEEMPSTSRQAQSYHESTIARRRSWSDDEGDYITPNTPPATAPKPPPHPAYTRTDIRYYAKLEEPEQSSSSPSSTLMTGHVQSQSPEAEPDESQFRTPVITHVVSKVIEPVTSVIIPSTSTLETRESFFLEEESPEELPAPFPMDENQAPPLRLEFLVEDDNVILQSAGVDHDTTEHDRPISASTAQLPEIVDTELRQRHVSPSPPILPDDVTSEEEQFSLPPTSPPAVVTVHPENILHRPSPKRMGILRQRLGQSRPGGPEGPTTPRTHLMKTNKPRTPQDKQTPRTKMPISTPSQSHPVSESKKRKLLDSLSKQTVDTISTLLTETSQSLLREMQDAEQRFISWEEEKRQEERSREEAMFTKLISAMKSSSGSVPTSFETPPEDRDHPEETPDPSFATTYRSMSKRLNDMVTDELKSTDETLRQWELKIQRQESRHTEKLFAMIINAIKTPSDVNRSTEFE